ncbi:hypothetical protein JOC74_001852 [Bacillus capparidis]|uniref:Uncharacterized protein n=1 Tax=Bacillus capparidis TaxID=1840411 RepID=A0ABS4CWE5_9BACI|nr:hypothetical protein [Bacillus capparidis]
MFFYLLDFIWLMLLTVAVKGAMNVLGGHFSK